MLPANPPGCPSSIRAFDPATASIEFVAGSGTAPNPETPVAGAAANSVGIGGMVPLAVQNGSLYLATSALVHRMDLGSRLITTVSGNGVDG